MQERPAGAGPGMAPNFKEWIKDNLGRGIARHFMFPYNNKVWAYPLEDLSAGWIGERVCQRPNAGDTAWGPNSVFRYPLRGGTGEIFRRMAAASGDNLRLNSKLLGVNPRTKRIRLSGGIEDRYDALINTSPLDSFLKTIDGCGKRLLRASRHLKHNSVFIVGIGLHKRCRQKRCWVYFPEKTSPFYRMTYLSNYSPNNAPDSAYQSLLCESAYSRYKKESSSGITDATIRGLVSSGILEPTDRKKIASTFLFDIDYAYPIPTLKRDEALGAILPELQRMGIYSRGRFGSWRYETGNMDHSCMQGKEAAEEACRSR